MCSSLRCERTSTAAGRRSGGPRGELEGADPPASASSSRDLTPPAIGSDPDSSMTSSRKPDAIRTWHTSPCVLAPLQCAHAMVRDSERRASHQGPMSSVGMAGQGRRFASCALPQGRGQSIAAKSTTVLMSGIGRARHVSLLTAGGTRGGRPSAARVTSSGGEVDLGGEAWARGVFLQRD